MHALASRPRPIPAAPGLLCAGVITVVTVALLDSLLLHDHSLVRIRAEWPPMAMPTATCFLLLALGQLSLELRASRADRRTALRLAAPVAAICATRLAFGAVGEDPPLPSVLGALDGMSPATAAGLLCGAAALAGLARGGGGLAGVVAALAMAGVAAIGLFGYLVAPKSLHAVTPFAAMSLPTSILLGALAGALLLSRRRPLMRALLTGRRRGSRIARAQLPVKGAVTAIVFVVVFHGHGGPETIHAAMAADALILLATASALMLSRRTDLAEAEADRRAAAVRRAERRRIEAELRAARALERGEAEKREALGRVVGGVAQDLNNALAVVSGNLELMRLEQDGVLRRRCEAEIDAGLLRMRDMAARLVSAGRRRTLFPLSLDVAAEAGKLAAAFDGRQGGALACTVLSDEETPVAWCDPQGFRDALHALLTNAEDSMPCGGRIVIEIAARPGAAPGGGDLLAITVRDRGEGMSCAMRDRATEPFLSSRKRPDRQGLGLSMVEGFCFQSGGGLDIESTPGLGTAATMLLPATTTRRAAPAQGAPRLVALTRSGARDREAGRRA